MKMSDPDWDVRDLGISTEITADDVFRSIIAQMFENDNDESEIACTLVDKRGKQCNVVFDLIITSIDGIKTRSGKAKDELISTEGEK
jgi:hypothetical protein